MFVGKYVSRFRYLLEKNLIQRVRSRTLWENRLFHNFLFLCRDTRFLGLIWVLTVLSSQEVAQQTRKCIVIKQNKGLAHWFQNFVVYFPTSEERKLSNWFYMVNFDKVIDSFRFEVEIDFFERWAEINAEKGNFNIVFSFLSFNSEICSCITTIFL